MTKKKSATPKSEAVGSDLADDDLTDSDLADSDLSYSDALEELETLLDQLEVSDVDIDHLAERVARGVQLVRFCRARLDVVTDDVQSVVSELLAPDPQSDTHDTYDEDSDDESEDSDE